MLRLSLPRVTAPPVTPPGVTVPAEGMILNISTNTIRDVLPSAITYPGLFVLSSPDRMINWTGACFHADDGNGSLSFITGGHNDGGDSSCYNASIDLLAFRRLNDPVPITSHIETISDFGEYEDYPAFEGTPAAQHTYGHIQSLSAAHGGGAKGSLIQLMGYSLLGGGSDASGWSHRCDVDTGVYSRFSLNVCPTAPGICITCADSNGDFWLTSGTAALVSKLDRTTRLWSSFNAGTAGGQNFGVNGYHSGCYCAQHNMFVVLEWPNPNAGPPATPFELWGLILDDQTSIETGWHLLNKTGDTPNPGYSGQSVDWAEWLGNFVVYEHQTNVLNHMTPPASSPLSSNWVFTLEAAFGGDEPAGYASPHNDPYYKPGYNRMRAVPSLECMIYFDTIDLPFQLWRPRT